jgi:hypothetical protein
MKRFLSTISALLLTLVMVLICSSATLAATIVIENADQPGVGFNDPTPAVPVGGNTGTTVGQQRLNAFQYAADFWGATIVSGPVITVRATWVALPCSANSGALGGAGAANLMRDFPNAPYGGTWYSIALANMFAGYDLNGSSPEIQAQFNSSVGTSGCLENAHWYYGFDNNDGSSGIDLVNVLLHEISHGLGFQTFTDPSSGAFMAGYPSIYDRFLFDNTNGKTWAQMSNGERVASAVNTGNLAWSGPRVDSDAALLGAGKDSSARPLMYAPNPVSAGSSVSHWDMSASPNQLLEPFISRDLPHSVTVPRDLTASLLADIGWYTSVPAPTPTPTPTPTATPTPTPVPANTVQFEFAGYNVGESAGSLQVVVTRPDTSGAATVDYSTNDYMAARCDTISGLASAKCDYATSGGTLRFAPGESSKTIQLLIVDDAFVEGYETLTISLSNPTGVVLGSPSSTTVTIQDNDSDPNASNPFLNNNFFVRMQYLDFLLRDPDTAGYSDWLNVINNCQPTQGWLGSDAGCDRVQVSSGFFRSTEFGEKGYWIYRFYEASLGRRPQFAEFMPEVRRLSGLMPDSEQEARRAEFINRFMQLPEFTSRYSALTGSQSASQFVAALEQSGRLTLPATVPPTQPGQPRQYGRQELIDLMQSGQLTAAQTLRAFIEQKVVWDTYYYRAFVAMQYFGYLRRDPDTAGYNDWVDVLTNGKGTTLPGDYRHLIFGFVYSVEYRERFGR